MRARPRRAPPCDPFVRNHLAFPPSMQRVPPAADPSGAAGDDPLDVRNLGRYIGGRDGLVGRVDDTRLFLSTPACAAGLAMMRGLRTRPSGARTVPAPRDGREPTDGQPTTAPGRTVSLAPAPKAVSIPQGRGDDAEPIAASEPHTTVGRARHSGSMLGPRKCLLTTANEQCSPLWLSVVPDEYLSYDQAGPPDGAAVSPIWQKTQVLEAGPAKPAMQRRPTPRWRR